jgi:hypothetical protein
MDDAYDETDEARDERVDDEDEITFGTDVEERRCKGREIEDCEGTTSVDIILKNFSLASENVEKSD